MARPKTLHYTGKIANGQPDRFFFGVPARDLDESDIAQLSDEQVRDIQKAPKDGSALYVAHAEKKLAPKKSAPAKKATVSHVRSATNTHAATEAGAGAGAESRTHADAAPVAVGEPGP